MTIKKNGFEKFAFLPKVCVWCNRKFIFEGYFNVADNVMATPGCVPQYIYCTKCANEYELNDMIEVTREDNIRFCLPEYLRR